MRALPDEFVAYHSRSSRLEGPVSSGVLRWFQLWPLPEIYLNNERYHVADFAPDLFGIGSDGGGEMLAFDAQNQLVMVPFVGMEMKYARLVAPSWKAFEHVISI